MKIQTILILVELDNGHVHQVLASVAQKDICIALLRSDDGVLRLSERVYPITLKLHSENEISPSTAATETADRPLDTAVAAMDAMYNPKCACGEDSTGWVEIKCCNICGLPHKDEAFTWSFSPANDQIHP